MLKHFIYQIKLTALKILPVIYLILHRQHKVPPAYINTPEFSPYSFPLNS